MTLTASVYSSFSRQDLIDMCRDNHVAGHSKKKVHELIDLLIRAGVHPKVTKANEAKPDEAPEPTEVTEVTQPASTTNTTNIPKQYIFHAHWSQVLPYLEEESAPLVLAEADSIHEAFRILEPTGTILLFGKEPELPDTYHTQWATIDGERVLCVQKSPQPVPTSYATLFKTAAVFATLHKLPQKSQSFIAMHPDKHHVEALYA